MEITYHPISELSATSQLLATSRLTRKDIERYGDTVGDYSSIHRDERIACACGLRSTPAIGTMINTLAWGLAARQGYTAIPLVQTSSIRESIFPEEELGWFARKVNGKLVIETRTAQSQEKNEYAFSPLDTQEDHTERKLHCSHQALYTEEKGAMLTELYPGIDPTTLQAAWMQALIPAGIIEIIRTRDPADIKAMHRNNDSTTYHLPKPGPATIRIYAPKLKVIGEGFIYKFEGEVVQQDGILGRALLKCTCSRKVDLEAIADKND